ncbi:hypothetical protein LJR034_003033 [Caballeronia sp. LjRoot34]|uniref:hypothetical protein n=1 Tax=Caballeronia sp. LjRoot34 TaxID=3342325 RepID=UPI003ECD5B6F
MDAGLLIEIFNLANCAANTLWVRTQCANSIGINTGALDGPSSSGFDALFIAGGEGATVAASDGRTIDWLKRIFRTARIVQASGNGPFLLEATSLPDTQGMIIPMLSPGNDPVMKVNAGSPVVTAFSLIKTDFDYQIAERLMPFSGRRLEPLIGDLPNTNVAVTIKEATLWIEEHCFRPITIDDMAQSVSMVERTFLPHFKAETGMPPSEYLWRTHLNTARRLLTTTTLPIDLVA